METYPKRVQTTLTLALAASVAPSAALAVLATELIEDLELSRLQLGLLFAAFSGTMGLWSLIAGAITDRSNTITLLKGVFWIAGFAAVTMAIAPGYAAMLIVLMLAALGAGFANPVTNKVIMDVFPPGRRGIAVGIKQSGVQIIYGIAGLALPTIASAWGWRAAIATLAFPSVIGLVLSQRSAFKGSRAQDVSPIEQQQDTELMANKLSQGIYWLGAYGLLMGMALSSVSGYLALYGNEGLGLSLNTAGLLLASASLVGLVTRITFGHWSESRGLYKRFLGWLSVLGLCGVVVIWTASWLLDGLVWIGAVLVGASLMAFNSVLMLAGMQEGGARRTGRASGVIVMGFMVGMTVGPPMFGYIIDRTGRYDVAWLAVASAIIGALVANLLSRRQSE